MKKTLFRSLSYVALSSALLLTACKDTQQDFTPTLQLSKDQQLSTDPSAYEGRYIVVFKDEVSTAYRSRLPQEPTRREEKIEYVERVRDIAQQEVKRLLAEVGIQRTSFEQIYGNVFLGFADKLTTEEVKILRQDSRIAIIEPDREVQLEPVEVIEHTNASQVTPWGITRVGGFVNAAGLSRWAWVIDSGIDLTHPDLTVNTQFSRTFVGGTPTDQNGHGTHVAGTIAARNNTIGVVGVAAGATVVSVRVFGASGSSSNSVIISGIDYVAGAALARDVVNMSLGGGASSAVDNATINAASKGLYIAVAAGNSSANANNFSPARVNYFNSSNGGRVITISAMDSQDRFASFSNFGNPPIDFCAPGVSIYSTYRNGGYATLSGTSMATPHVAGIMLVNNGTVRTNGFVRNDPDGNPDPIAVR